MQTTKHIVLAGDSIFDNDAYVPGEPGLIEQMRKAIPEVWSAFKLAEDGACMCDIPGQISNLPTHATDLVVSIGGNDLIEYSSLLSAIRSPDQVGPMLAGPRAAFAAQYASMLDELIKLPVSAAVCTIYTAIPFPEPNWRLFAPLAIGAFNDLIIEEAGRRNIPVLRLDQVCTEADDFSAVSEIEPSAKGAQKIVDCIIGRLGGPVGA